MRCDDIFVNKAGEHFIKRKLDIACSFGFIKKGQKVLEIGSATGIFSFELEKFGIEKEALRVNSSGELALTPHPEIFGDKLENPSITVDFSESQIEMITPPVESLERSISILQNIHTEVEESINSELLWPLSMPSILPIDSEIPIAKYNQEIKL